MRIGVTGAVGRIGRHVVPILIADGHEVVAIDRLSPGLGGYPDAEYLTDDLNDVDKLAKAFEGVESVIHLAGIGAPTPADPSLCFNTNVLTTFSVLSAAARAHVEKTVLASSASALGMAWASLPEPPLYAPIDEAHPLRPADHYALTKQILENTAAAFNRETGISTAILRFPCVADTMSLVERAVAVAADPLDDVAFRDVWSYIHITDIARAFASAAYGPRIGCEVFNVVAPDTLSDVPTEELLKEFYPTTRITEPIHGKAPAWSTRKIQQCYGYESRISWRDLAPGSTSKRT